MRIHSALSIGLFIVDCHLCATPFWLRLYLLPYQECSINVSPPSSDQGIPRQDVLWQKACQALTMVHDKYQHLETLYGQVGSMATFNAWVSLVNTKLQEGSPFCSQLQAILEARNTLAENGMTFSDMQMCFILLDALPPSYSTVAGAILAQGAPAALVPQDLINRFLNEESRLNGPLGTLYKVNPIKPSTNNNKGKQRQAQKLQHSSSSTPQGSSSEVT